MKVMSWKNAMKIRCVFVFFIFKVYFVDINHRECIRIIEKTSFAINMRWVKIFEMKYSFYCNEILKIRFSFHINRREREREKEKEHQLTDMKQRRCIRNLHVQRLSENGHVTMRERERKTHTAHMYKNEVIQEREIFEILLFDREWMIISQEEVRVYPFVSWQSHDF